MSLAIKYENREDARMRLRNTVVLYSGRPVLIVDIANGEGKDDILRVLFNELPVGADAVPLKKKYDPFRAKILEGAPELAGENRKYISSKHFDIGAFKLGYVNDPKIGAFYCSRLPNHIQKQGLCTENFKGTTNFGGGVPFGTFLASRGTPLMVANDYPSFEVAMRNLDKVPAVAFCREFSLVKDEVIPDLIYLYHKGSKVGYYSKNETILGKKFVCLKESLEEMRIKVGVC